MKKLVVRSLRCVAALALVVAQVGFGHAQPAAAAPGDLVADVIVPEGWPRNVSPSVAFDGHFLYYTEYAGSILHRINMPPAGATTQAAPPVDATIVGAPAGIMSIAYDASRDMFWATGGDGLSIYLLAKTGAATLMFTIDPVNDRPGWQARTFITETKLAYDGTDDTIWYSPDAVARIYHYQSYADAQGTATLVAATPFIDVGVPPNDMEAQCGFSQSSGVAAGGGSLFVDAMGCPYYFEYSKTGTKLGWYAYNGAGPQSQESIACDNVTYAVPVFWIRDGYDAHIRAFEQPSLGACSLGGGGAAAPARATPKAP